MLNLIFEDIPRSLKKWKVSNYHRPPICTPLSPVFFFARYVKKNYCVKWNRIFGIFWKFSRNTFFFTHTFFCAFRSTLITKLAKFVHFLNFNAQLLFSRIENIFFHVMEPVFCVEKKSVEAEHYSIFKISERPINNFIFLKCWNMLLDANFLIAYNIPLLSQKPYRVKKILSLRNLK